MSTEKRAPLTGNDNTPKLREPKPPFGLSRPRWHRLRVQVFGVGALLLAAFVLWIITQRNNVPEEHRIQGQRLAAYYETAAERVGCEEETVVESSALVGIHQGFAGGPVLVDCSLAQECETVSARDPEISSPATFSGPVEEVIWSNYASVPNILLDVDGSWVSSQKRSWIAEGHCHTVLREEILALVDGRLTQTVEIRHGGHACTTLEEAPALRCVHRRVRELRTPRP